jgi:membrane dipeptidase
MKGMSKYCIFLVMGAAASLAAKEDPANQKARNLHFSSLVFDTHVDTTSKLQSGWKFQEEHKDGNLDLPRMKRGGLNALFLSIYMPGTVTGPKAVNDALESIASVRELADQLPGEISLCTSSGDVIEARRKGRIAVLMGMEGGHMINNSLPILRMYAALGIRYLTLTHSINTDWADSSGDQAAHNGLTEFGKSVVKELNRLGVMVDMSHVSDKTFRDVLEISRAPIIASHSSCRALCPHPRNMTDEMIKALAAKGGVIQINYHVEFLDTAAMEYYRKSEPLFRQVLSAQSDKHDYSSAQVEVTRQLGPPPVISWTRIIDHLDHAVKLVGADHVGLGSDFDGAVMPEGLTDVSMLPKITEALVRKGYKDSDIKKILGENTLRILSAAEQIAKALNSRPR